MPEQCTYVKFGEFPLPLVIGDGYCHVIPFFGPMPVSGYLTCDGDKIMWEHWWGSTNCSGMYNSTIEAQYQFGPWDEAVCLGNASYCDVAWLTLLDFMANETLNETLDITEEDCVEQAKENGVARFAIPMDQCFGFRAFGCDENYEFTMDFYNEWNCSSFNESNLNRGLDINNTADEVSCVYAWKEDGEICPLPDCSERNTEGYVIADSCDGSCTSDSCYYNGTEYESDDTDVTCTPGMLH